MPSITSTLAFGRPTIGGGTQGVQLFIANVNRTSYLCAKNTLRIDRQTKGRSKMSFSLEVHNGSGYVPTVGNPVILSENGIRLFGGFITEYRQKRHMTTDHNFVFDVQCTDWAAICDHRVVFQRYGAGEFGYVIMRDIAEGFLDGEGITTNGTFGITQTSEAVEFIGSTVTEAFDRACDLSEMTWWIDPYKDLKTTSIALAEAAPFDLDEFGANWRNLSVRVTSRDYRNIQYIKSNKNIITATRSETFTSDGVNSWFLVTKFGLTAAPVVIVDGVEQTIYELGVDPYNQDGWYWIRDGYGVQQGNQTAPPAGQEIVVEYGSFAANYTRFDDDVDEIAARAAIEGGSGKWEAVTDINEVANEDQALMYAEALKRRSGSMLKEVEYETDYKGLEPGMKQTIDIPNDGLSGEFLITSVTSRAMGINTDLGDGSSFRHTVKCSNIEDQGNWVKYWERLNERTKQGSVETQYGFMTFVLGPNGAVEGTDDMTNPLQMPVNAEIVETSYVSSTPQSGPLEITFVKNSVSLAAVTIPDGDPALSVTRQQFAPTVPGSGARLAAVDDVVTVNVAGTVEKATVLVKYAMTIME